ncbi:hypothetical protein ACOL23_04690, partial [Aliarcobacter butzleri]
MKFERPNSNIVPFGTNANENKRFAFGTNNYTNDINENLNDSFKLGWETVGINSKPPRQWFNGLAYASTYLTSYLFQAGIPEWNEEQEFFLHSRTIGSDGKIYRSLAGTSVAPNIGNNPTTDTENWKDDAEDFVKLTGANITVTVGSGGDYSTINQALEYLSKLYPVYKSSGVTATIQLKAGFVMAEQVLVSGIDLGWITITGVDAETLITHTTLTTDFTSVDYGFISYPAFGVSKGGVLPRIGQLFNMNLGVSGASSNKYGVVAIGAGSSAEILPTKGVKNAGNVGIYSIYGST